jgi:hypothetical protein
LIKPTQVAHRKIIYQLHPSKKGMFTTSLRLLPPAIKTLYLKKSIVEKRALCGCIPSLEGQGWAHLCNKETIQSMMALVQCTTALLNDAVSKLRVEAAIWKQQKLIVAICSLHDYQLYFKELNKN